MSRTTRLLGIAALLFVALQLWLFGGHSADIRALQTQREQEAGIDRTVQSKLREAERDGQLLQALEERLSDAVAHKGQPLAALTGWSPLPGSDAADQGPEEAEPDNGSELQTTETDGAAMEPNDDKCVLDSPSQGAVAGVVVVAFNRSHYLQRMLESMLGVHGSDPANARRFPLHVSQDGQHGPTKDVALSFAGRGVRHMQHIEAAPPQLRSHKESPAYYRIANHYAFIMRQFFECNRYDRLIILEEDMELAPDFFSYFAATAPLLDADPTLMCVSSWNDHGQDKFVRDPTRLYRSDFFPGLGWMLRRQLWEELRDEWPDSYWDDWMRLNITRKGRQCIRPEICRTYNFGVKGSSKGQFYRRYLQPIRLNSEDVRWEQLDLSYLAPEAYQRQLEEGLARARQVAGAHEAMQAEGEVKLLYDSQEQYEALTGRLGMLREWKDGVPRGAYRGVVVVAVAKARIYIAPSPDFRPPDPALPVRGVDATGAVIRRRNRRNRRKGRPFG